MNGVHDLGGMQGFGPVVREENEPVFHAGWERSMVAIQVAGRRRGWMNLDEFRHAIERMDPGHYLASSYYEHWLDGIARLLLEKGLLSEAELDERTRLFEAQPDATFDAGAPAAGIEAPPGIFSFRRETDASPRFSPGDAVVTRNLQAHGHTRLPRYARGKRGVVDRNHGIYVFADTNAHGFGEQPQPLYSVRFSAQELWGESAESREQLYIDLWESYLLPV
jgi:nitrile hydratase